MERQANTSLHVFPQNNKNVWQNSCYLKAPPPLALAHWASGAKGGWGVLGWHEGSDTKKSTKVRGNRKNRKTGHLPMIPWDKLAGVVQVALRCAVSWTIRFPSLLLYSSLVLSMECICILHNRFHLCSPVQISIRTRADFNLTLTTAGYLSSCEAFARNWAAPRRNDSCQSEECSCIVFSLSP